MKDGPGSDKARLQRIWDNGACSQCRHMHDDGATCDAFPDRIPLQVLAGDVDHLSPLEGDRGIRFEPAEDADDSPPEPGSQCLSCENYSRHGGYDSFVCKAFMGQIPDEIWANLYDHRRPFEGDDGVRFEPVEGADPEVLEGLYAALDEVEPHHSLTGDDV